MSIINGLSTTAKVVGIVVTTAASAVVASGVGSTGAAVAIHATGNDPQQQVKWTEKSGPFGLRKKTYVAQQNMVTGQLTGVTRVKK